MIISAFLLLQGCYTIVMTPPEAHDNIIRGIVGADLLYQSQPFLGSGSAWDPWWEPSYPGYGYGANDPFSSFDYGFGYYGNPYGGYSPGIQYNPYYDGYVYYPSYGFGKLSPAAQLHEAREVGRGSALGETGARPVPVSPLTVLLQQQLNTAPVPGESGDNPEKSNEEPNPVLPLAAPHKNKIDFSTQTPPPNAVPVAAPDVSTPARSSTTPSPSVVKPAAADAPNDSGKTEQPANQNRKQHAAGGSGERR